MPATYWVILGFVLLIGEIFTLDFSLSCFGIACFIVAIVSGFGLGLYWQLGVLAAVILALLFTLRPLAVKYLNRHAKGFKSNMEALIGKQAAVFNVHADGKKAMIKIDADEWAVIANEPLKERDMVTVLSIDGTTLTVKKEEK